MRRIPAKIISPALQIYVKHYFKKPRPYRYKGIKGIVHPGVFFPQFTISTKMLLQFLEVKELKGQQFLELGCGTGLVSVMAAQRGANVTASDINPAAIENAKDNAKRNAVKIQTILSDLFTEIPTQIFDTVIINPPYYPKDPKNRAEEAWFCGSAFEYFEKLFPALPQYFNADSEVFMILSEDCEFERIKAIAAKSQLTFSTVLQKKKWGEVSFIYRLVLDTINFDTVKINHSN
ncbi:MAG: methyltransferase [Crocinitomix sp.]|nr:methyltransferase [Crocinitomix sp.]